MPFRKRGDGRLHIALHFMVPAAVALVFFRKRRLAAYLWMMAAMIVDMDHLMADPVYDPMRCSIGFHPMHGIIPIAVYAVLCLFPKTRILGLGLCIHMILDAIDCQMTNGVWYVSAMNLFRQLNIV